MRADPELGATPFIMVTAESKTENVIAARKAGVNNYIVKPLYRMIMLYFIDISHFLGFWVALGVSFFHFLRLAPQSRAQWPA